MTKDTKMQINNNVIPFVENKYTSDYDLVVLTRRLNSAPSIIIPFW